MKPIRVLHLIPSFVGGGAERQLAYTVSALAQLGADVRIACVAGGPNLSRLERSGFTVLHIERYGNHDPLIFVRLLRLIRTIRPDIVQTWLLQMDVLGGAAAIAAGIPWVLAERSSAQMYASGWKNRVRRRIGARATAIVANSAGGIAYWRSRPQAGFDRVIHNIIPFGDIDAATGLPEDIGSMGAVDELVIAAGRLDEGKSPLRLLELFELVLDRRTRAHAVIFGSGPLDRTIRETHEKLRNRGRIHLLPYTANLWHWMKRASACVSLSQFEGAPNVVLEAVVAGCPVVVSDIPAHREVLPADCAIWARPEAVEEAAVEIDRLLSDRVRAQAMARRARSALGPWTAASVAGEYMLLYRQILDTKS